MASLSIARPGKVSERQYLGDLACLFDRQRTRAGLALTPASFASDLAASDSLRSGLFTLCSAISRMSEQDLSAEELLYLVARALAGKSTDGPAPPVPADMRDAFLTGYAAWQDRGLEPLFAFDASDVWPTSPNAARKPGARDRLPPAPAGVIPFPARSAEDHMCAPSVATSVRPEMASAAADDRPPGIDALVAAAPAWANAVPAARSADTSLSRRAALSARKLFIALAGVTALAAAIAGVIAYRTLY